MDYEVMMNGNVRIGEYAPEFEANSTFGNISLKDFKGKWLVLFSHPGDFTPLCTTEMIAFSNAYPYFQERNTNLLGLSVDSNPSHLAWVYDIYNRTGVEVPFPIIEDRNGSIARKYGMISNSIDNTATVRNVYIIDDKGIIRAILIYPMETGRFIPEIIRIIDALQFHDKNNLSTAANWMVGNPGIRPVPKTYKELTERVNDLQKNDNGMSWYLSFQNDVKKIEDNK